jgi:hypothetical protein
MVLARQEGDGNRMPQGYAFNLDLDRFDNHVLNAYRDGTVARWTRDRLIAQVCEGKLDHFLLTRVEGLENLPVAAAEKAAINVIDFLFEPFVLRTMSVPQLASYFQRVHKTFPRQDVSGLDADGPLWIDTLHHACSFSITYELIAYLVRQRGYRGIVLLHQGQRQEMRLDLIAKVMRQVLNIEPDYMLLTGHWFSLLAQKTGPDTAIFYLADMPQDTSKSTAPKERRSYTIQLDPAPDTPVRLETLSGSRVFARRLGAVHVVLDYPHRDCLRVRPFDAGAPVALCPVEDWMFWPLLKAA